MHPNSCQYPKINYLTSLTQTLRLATTKAFTVCNFLGKVHTKWSEICSPDVACTRNPNSCQYPKINYRTSLTQTLHLATTKAITVCNFLGKVHTKWSEICSPDVVCTRNPNSCQYPIINYLTSLTQTLHLATTTNYSNYRVQFLEESAYNMNWIRSPDTH